MSHAGLLATEMASQTAAPLRGRTLLQTATQLTGRIRLQTAAHEGD